MAAYAAGTTVSSEKSRAEIERILTRYGSEAFSYATDGLKVVIQFRAHDRFVRFVLPLPVRAEHVYSTAYRSRTESQINASVEQETRRRWRALALAIKAKLEVVESQIATFEEEFAAHILLPDGSSVSDWLMPHIAHAYESNDMPSSLMELPSGVKEIEA